MQLFSRQVRIIKQALLTTLILFFICEAAGLFVISLHKQSLRQHSEQQMRCWAEKELRRYEKLTTLTFRKFEGELIQLGANEILHNFINLLESEDSQKIDDARNAVIDELLEIIKRSPEYIDIKLFDAEAEELLNVGRWTNDHILTGRNETVEDSISQYWLFINRRDIPLNTSFSRGFSYEKDAGKEESDRLGFRLFARIQNDNGTPFFIALILRANALFAELPDKYQKLWQTTVLDRNGFYLYDSNNRKTMGHFYNHRRRRNIAAVNIGLSWQIRKDPAGKYEDEKNFYVFRNITLPYAAEEQKLYTVISSVSKESLAALPIRSKAGFRAAHLLLALFSLLFAGGCGIVFFFFRSHQQHKSFAVPILDNMSPALIRSRSGKIVYVNNEFAALCDFSKSEIRFNEELFKSGLQSDAFYKELWTTVGGNREYSNEIINCNQRGENVPLQIKIQPISRKYGKPLGYLATYINVSEQKKIEEELETLTFIDEEADIPNQRYFLNKLNYQSRLVKRYGDRHECSLAVLHFTGQENNVAFKRDFFKKLAHFFRKTDRNALLDNGMFAILMPLTRPEEAEALLKRFLRTVKKDFPDLQAAAAIGALSGVDDDQQSYEEGVFQAKRALKKELGVVVFSEINRQAGRILFH